MNVVSLFGSFSYFFWKIFLREPWTEQKIECGIEFKKAISVVINEIITPASLSQIAGQEINKRSLWIIIYLVKAHLTVRYLSHQKHQKNFKVWKPQCFPHVDCSRGSRELQQKPRPASLNTGSAMFNFLSRFYWLCCCSVWFFSCCKDSQFLSTGGFVDLLSCSRVNVATQLMNKTACYKGFLQFCGQIFSHAGIWNNISICIILMKICQKQRQSCRWFL